MIASRPRRKFFAFTILLLCVSGGYSHATEIAGPQLPKQESTVKSDKQNRLEDNDIKKTDAYKNSEKEAPADKTIETAPALEGAGLYQKATEGSLGSDMWQGAARSTITELMKAMPVSSPYAPIQKLMFGAWLSQTDPSLMKNDAPIKQGEDLLSLRLQKLIEAGAYSQALELYSSLNWDQPPESVAKYGILAMLFNHQLSLACIELHTVADSPATNEFFKTLKNQCDNQKPYDGSAPEITYDVQAFGKLSMLDKAMAVATKMIKMNQPIDKAKADRSFKYVPPADIQIVMKAANLSDEDKFNLNLRAVEWGLMSPEDLTKSYISTIKLDIRKDPELAAPDKIADWQKLPYDLQIAMNKKSSDEQWPFIRAALAIADAYGSTALLPFAELIYKAEPKNPTFKEMKTAVLVLNRAGYDISHQWSDIVEKYSPKDNEKAIYARLLAAAYLSKQDGKKNESLKSLIEKDLSPLPASSTDFIKNIIENLDKDAVYTHNANVILENNNLTKKTDYVMQSVTMRNQLLEASHNGHIGETVLLAVTALHETPLDKTEPGLFLDTLRSLRTVGLTEISDTIAMRAVLGDIE